MNALNLQQANAVVWNNLGAVLQRSGRLEDAALPFENATIIDPGFADALNNLGNPLTLLGRNIDAARCFCEAYVLQPNPQKPKAMLGIAYYYLGRIEEATAVYRQWLEAEPDSPVARHLSAACSGVDVPARAADAYVEAYFAEFAEAFEKQLVESISYQVPALVGAALKDLAIPAHALAILDAGCGTGLCGSYLAPYARRLTGVDLSQRSLAVAAQKKIYDDLVKAELTDYLSRSAAAYDVVAMADTLIYFGRLEELFQAVASALGAGGILVASVEESASGAGYAINPSGRYSHSRDYLTGTLRASGFAIDALDPVAVRVELGNPVKGLFVVARRRN